MLALLFQTMLYLFLSIIIDWQWINIRENYISLEKYILKTFINIVSWLRLSSHLSPSLRNYALLRRDREPDYGFDTGLDVSQVRPHDIPSGVNIDHEIQLASVHNKKGKKSVITANNTSSEISAAVITRVGDLRDETEGRGSETEGTRKSNEKDKERKNSLEEEKLSLEDTSEVPF